MTPRVVLWSGPCKDTGCMQENEAWANREGGGSRGSRGTARMNGIPSDCVTNKNDTWKL